MVELLNYEYLLKMKLTRFTKISDVGYERRVKFLKIRAT